MSKRVREFKYIHGPEKTTWTPTTAVKPRLRPGTTSVGPYWLCIGGNLMGGGKTASESYQDWCAAMDRKGIGHLIWNKELNHG